MRKLIILSLSLLLGGSMTAAAQQILRGTVKDSLTKQPVPGATVKVIGSTKGATTNAEGEFELNVPANAQLQISSMGFENVIIKASLISTGPVLMKVRAVDLNSTVIVGYGSQQRATVTNSISTVGSAALAPEKNIVSDAGKALQGRVAGVWVANTSGSPGNSPNIQIRGAQSVAASNTNPLLVIDGLIVEGGSIHLNTINPQDIESMEVLKDAASAAIYGARGSSGVIIITTKKGKFNSKPTFNVNAYTGVNNVHTSRRMLTSEEYKSAFLDARNNRLADINRLLNDPNANLDPNQKSQLNNEIKTLTSQVNGLNVANRSTNWIEKIKNKNAPVSNVQASMSGGGEKNSYFMSLGRYSEEVVWGTGRFERYTGRLDVTQAVNNWLKLNGGLSINQSVSKNISNPIAYAFQARPDTPEEPIYNADGTLGYYIGMQQHPLGAMLDNKNRYKTNSYIGKLAADVTITKDLQFRSAFNAGKVNTISRDFYSPYTYLGKSGGGSTKTSGTDNFNFTFDNYFTYNKRISRLGINATAGYTYYSNELSSLGYDLTGYPKVDGITGPGAGSAYGSIGAIANYNTYSKELSDGYFLRTGMDWQGKYLLNASIRRDGSSKLLKENRYSWFPSISGGWDIAKENFLYGNRLISQLKLRTSYGISGNMRPLGLWDAQNLLVATSYNGVSALQMNGLIGNPNIRWERTKQVDAGIDATLLQNRLTLAVDYYSKLTDGLMSRNEISWIYGAQSIPDNIGNIRNRGVDVEMALSSKAGRAFSWKVATNFNVNRNKIISLKDSLTNYGTFIFGGPQSKAKVGQSVGSVMVYESLGVDPQTGDMVYKDQNKDGKWDSNDMITVPIAVPAFTGGTTITMGYKGFSLEALFSYVSGNKIYDYYEQTLRSYDIDFYGAMPNMFDIVNKRWRKAGDVTDVPRAITGRHGAGQTADWNYRPSTQFIYNASYFRLRNVTLGYTVPATVLTKVKMTSARVYVAAQNLFTITKYIGFDPEAASNSGIVTSNMPNPQSAVIGLDLTF